MSDEEARWSKAMGSLTKIQRDQLDSLLETVRDWYLRTLQDAPNLEDGETASIRISGGRVGEHNEEELYQFSVKTGLEKLA